MYENEIWKPISGYECYYDVSNLGRVRSLDRYDKFGRLFKGRLLKPGNDKDGYNLVVLSKNGKTKHYKVHRLVAQAFIQNPNNLPIINHKDECKTNNNYLNLEWCTYKYNNEYSGNTEKWLNTTVEKQKKPVIQLTKNNEFVAEYESIRYAERITGIKNTAISFCCRGIKYKTAGGYKWKYKIDYEQEQRAND